MPELALKSPVASRYSSYVLRLLQSRSRRPSSNERSPLFAPSFVERKRNAWHWSVDGQNMGQDATG